jgi:cation-transporting ATPase 13A2
MSQGIDEETHNKNQLLYGPNLITVPLYSYVFLLLNEVYSHFFLLIIKKVLHPFYIFQIFSMIIWSMDDYYVYASCIFVTSSIAAISNVVQIRQNMQKLVFPLF